MEGVEGLLFYKASGALHNILKHLSFEQWKDIINIEISCLTVCAGGHGKRKLVAITPDVDGYTGRLIHSASAAGKTVLYIAPLQQELDMTPLPSDAAEFQKTPKAACQKCKERMPLHILALHIQSCMEPQDDFDDDEVNAYI